MTATNRFITEPIAELLGIDALIATEPEIVDGCYGDCVDPDTCEPVMMQVTCGDGTELQCREMAPRCPEGSEPEIVNNCYGRCYAIIFPTLPANWH